MSKFLSQSKAPLYTLLFLDINFTLDQSLYNELKYGKSIRYEYLTPYIVDTWLCSYVGICKYLMLCSRKLTTLSWPSFLIILWVIHFMMTFFSTSTWKWFSKFWAPQCGSVSHKSWKFPGCWYVTGTAYNCCSNKKIFQWVIILR